jgi:hypothetical protein
VQIINETLPALQQLKTQGLVRFVGITGLPLKALQYVLDRVPAGATCRGTRAASAAQQQKQQLHISALQFYKGLACGLCVSRLLCRSRLAELIYPALYVMSGATAAAAVQALLT